MHRYISDLDFARSKRLALFILTVLVVILSTAQNSLAQGNSVPKLPFHGLLSMGSTTFNHEVNGIPDNTDPLKAIAALPAGIFDGIAINITWSQLQPTSSATLDTTAIDQALANIEAYNAANPLFPLGVRLRIWSGHNTPPWVQSLGGAPVTIYFEGNPYTIGRFWTPAYMKAWRNLQNTLAARYDKVSLIRSVTVTSCSTETEEPFIIPLDDTSLANLHAAGFNDAAYYQCLLEAPNDYNAWESTRVEFPFNPFHITDINPPQLDYNFPNLLMNVWKAKRHEQAILSNYDLDCPFLKPLVPIYSDFETLGPLIEFQMYSPDISYWNAAVEAAVQLRATAVELWTSCTDQGCYQGGFGDVPAETLQQWSQELKSNPL